MIKHSENFNSQQSSNESRNKFWHYKRATNGETYFLLIYQFFMAFNALRDKARVGNGTNHPIGNPKVIKFPQQIYKLNDMKKKITICIPSASYHCSNRTSSIHSIYQNHHSLKSSVDVLPWYNLLSVWVHTLVKMTTSRPPKTCKPILRI